MQFTPSTDHDKLATDNVTPLLSSYLLVINAVGSTQTVWSVDLGKPTPEADGQIRAEFVSKLQPPPYSGTSYEARVLAVGPGGSTASAPYGTFSFSTAPPPKPAVSADLTAVPRDATQIVDSNFETWTIGTGLAILKNGQSTCGGAGSIIFWSGGKIYVFGTDNVNWFLWNGPACWSLFGPTPPPGWSTAPNPAPLAIACPANVTAASLDGQPVAVAYPLPTASGGTPPYTLSETPVSGSLFPVGSSVATGSVSDATGATKACSFTVTVTYTPSTPTDTTPPTVTVQAPLQSGNSANFTLRATAIDNVKIAKVFAWIDGRALTTRTTTGPSYSWAVSLARGPHTVTVQAQDAAGNNSLAVSLSFRRQ